MKSFRMTGMVTASAAAARWAMSPSKREGSVTTEIAAAPAPAYDLARRRTESAASAAVPAASRRPAAGERSLISAMRSKPGPSRASGLGGGHSALAMKRLSSASGRLAFASAVRRELSRAIISRKPLTVPPSPRDHAADPMALSRHVPLPRACRASSSPCLRPALSLPFERAERREEQGAPSIVDRRGRKPRGALRLRGGPHELEHERRAEHDGVAMRATLAPFEDRFHAARVLRGIAAHQLLDAAPGKPVDRRVPGLLHDPPQRHVVESERPRRGRFVPAVRSVDDEGPRDRHAGERLRDQRRRLAAERAHELI